MKPENTLSLKLRSICRLKIRISRRLTESTPKVPQTNVATNSTKRGPKGPTRTPMTQKSRGRLSSSGLPPGGDWHCHLRHQCGLSSAKVLPVSITWRQNNVAFRRRPRRTLSARWSARRAASAWRRRRLCNDRPRDFFEAEGDHHSALRFYRTLPVRRQFDDHKVLVGCVEFGLARKTVVASDRSGSAWDEPIRLGRARSGPRDTAEKRTYAARSEVVVATLHRR